MWGHRSHQRAQQGSKKTHPDCGCTKTLQKGRTQRMCLSKREMRVKRLAHVIKRVRNSETCRVSWLENQGRATLQLTSEGQNALLFRKVKVFVAQSCSTLCDPMDCSWPASSVHGILQARILEWVDIPFSRGSSQPRDQTQVSCIAGGFLTVLREAQEGLSFSSTQAFS